MENEYEHERWVRVFWAEGHERAFQSSLNIQAKNRIALVADISNTLVKLRIPLTGLTTNLLKEGTSIVLITIEVKNIGQLQTAISRLYKIKGVISIARA